MQFGLEVPPFSLYPASFPQLETQPVVRCLKVGGALADPPIQDAACFIGCAEGLLELLLMSPEFICLLFEPGMMIVVASFGPHHLPTHGHTEAQDDGCRQDLGKELFVRITG